MKTNSDQSYDQLYSILLNDDNIQQQKTIQANNVSSFFLDKNMNQFKYQPKNNKPARVREYNQKGNRSKKELKLNRLEKEMLNQKEQKEIEQIKNDIESQLQQRVQNQSQKEMMQKMIIEKLQTPQSTQKLQSNKYQFDELFVKPKKNELKKIQEEKQEDKYIEDEDILMQKLRRVKMNKKINQNEELEIKVEIKIKKQKQNQYIYNQLFYLEIPKKNEIDDFDQKNIFLENGFICAIPLIDYEDLDSLQTKILDMKLKLKGDKNNNEEYKKAHLNFILAFYFEKQNRFKKAIIQYKKFIKNCVILEDKEGIMIASN